MIKRIKILAALLLMQSAVGVAIATEIGELEDQDVAIERVISAGGSISEWVVAVGAEAQLVGVDTTSLHPVSLQNLPSVGYQRQLAAEGVLTLQPHVLFGSAEMGPPPVLEQLCAAGVQIERLPVDANLAAVSQSVRRIGAVLARAEQAERALDHFNQAMRLQQQKLQAVQGVAPRVLLLFSAGQGNPLTAGSNTVGDWLIKQSGGENLARHEGFKALSSESMLALNPQILIVADRHNQSIEALEKMLSSAAALQYTDAVKNKRILAIDPTLLVGGLGPRLPEQVAQLIEAFYPPLHSLAKTE
ncbi:MAG: ABC transporter substrate-binding protein [Pseudomonas sp.]|nr:ABC transporter substrate-binding protein [Pseudomonas sp.]